jgi:hypothetical protein
MIAYDGIDDGVRGRNGAMKISDERVGCDEWDGVCGFG